MQLLPDGIDEPTQTPERKLLVAILRRAVFDYFGAHSQERSAAEEWFFGESSESEKFSFAWVCLQLGFEESRILTRLRSINPKHFHAQQRYFDADAERSDKNFATHIQVEEQDCYATQAA